MVKLNTIFSDAEYMRQGFTAEEVPLVRRHDELFNKYQIEGELPEDEKQEMFDLVDTLGL